MGNNTFEELYKDVTEQKAKAEQRAKEEAAKRAAEEKAKAEAEAKKRKKAEQVAKALGSGKEEERKKRAAVNAAILAAISKGLDSMSRGFQGAITPEQEANEIAERVNVTRAWAEQEYDLEIVKDRKIEKRHIAELLAKEAARMTPEEMRDILERRAIQRDQMQQLEEVRKKVNAR